MAKLLLGLSWTLSIPFWFGQSRNSNVMFNSVIFVSLFTSRYSLSMRSDQPPFVIFNRLIMSAQINVKLWMILLIFSWDIYGGLFTPIGSHLYRYFSYGSIIVNMIFLSYLRRMWKYAIFKLNNLEYLILSNFSKILDTFGMG